jgi:hypothetical protein
MVIGFLFLFLPLNNHEESEEYFPRKVILLAMFIFIVPFINLKVDWDRFFLPHMVISTIFFGLGLAKILDWLFFESFEFSQKLISNFQRLN